MNDMALLGKQAAKQLALWHNSEKNRVLAAMAKALESHHGKLLDANAIDLSLAQGNQLSPALLERLTLNPEKIDDMARGILALTQLPDPVGEIIEAFDSPAMLGITKVRVPLGLLLMIYESRPNVTADAAALAIKSGNAIILKGGKESLHTNKAIADLLIESAEAAGLPPNTIQFIDNSDRALTNALMVDVDHVDAIIPRGGPALKKAILAVAKVPVLMTGSGVCHLFIDESAKPEMATAIALNSKVQRPRVCNAIESLLIHKAYPHKLPLLLALLEQKVELRLSEELYALMVDHCETAEPQWLDQLKLATSEDYAAEFLSLILAVKEVASLSEAVSHIQRYSTGHSEAIVSESLENAETFMNAVDAACVYHNASTRFTDGGCFGFGCEMGIATQKLHARGPMGLRELTSYKYKIHGSGHIR